MNKKVLYLVGISFVSSFLFGEETFATAQGIVIRRQNDTIGAEVKAFKEFSKKFFSAVGKSDTNFLKSHVIFPISNSSFYIFDLKLLNKKIDSKMFFRNLKKIFPDTLIKRISKDGEFSCNSGNNGLSTCVIEISDIEGGID